MTQSNVSLVAQVPDGPDGYTFITDENCQLSPELIVRIATSQQLSPELQKNTLSHVRSKLQRDTGRQGSIVLALYTQALSSLSDQSREGIQSRLKDLLDGRFVDELLPSCTEQVDGIARSPVMSLALQDLIREFTQLRPATALESGSDIRARGRYLHGLAHGLALAACCVMVLVFGDILRFTEHSKPSQASTSDGKSATGQLATAASSTTTATATASTTKDESGNAANGLGKGKQPSTSLDSQANGATAAARQAPSSPNASSQGQHSSTAQTSVESDTKLSNLIVFYLTGSLPRDEFLQYAKQEPLDEAKLTRVQSHLSMQPGIDPNALKTTVEQLKSLLAHGGKTVSQNPEVDPRRKLVQSLSQLVTTSFKEPNRLRQLYPEMQTTINRSGLSDTAFINRLKELADQLDKWKRDGWPIAVEHRWNCKFEGLVHRILIDKKPIPLVQAVPSLLLTEGNWNAKRIEVVVETIAESPSGTIARKFGGGIKEWNGAVVFPSIDPLGALDWQDARLLPASPDATLLPISVQYRIREPEWVTAFKALVTEFLGASNGKLDAPQPAQPYP